MEFVKQYIKFVIEIHPCHFHHPVFDTPMMRAKNINLNDDDDDDNKH